MERTLKKKRANYKNLSERDEKRGKGKSGNLKLFSCLPLDVHPRVQRQV